MTAPLTDAQAAQLREAAQKATPGPWDFRWISPACGFEYAATITGAEMEDGGRPIVADLPPRTVHGTHQANSEFIALANPATILALLDEREVFLAAVADPNQGLWRYWNDKAVEMVAERDALRAERDAEADRRKTSEAVVDRIWDIFGRPSYEELAGRSIYDLITEAKAEAVRLRQALETIASQRSQIFSHGDMSNREAFSIASAALTTKGTAE